MPLPLFHRDFVVVAKHGSYELTLANYFVGLRVEPATVEPATGYHFVRMVEAWVC